MRPQARGATLRVVKLGGSLLEWPDLSAAFRKWLAAEPPAASVLVVGGGPLVEAIRALDRVHGMSDEAAHWLAIRTMSVTAALVAELFGMPLVDSLAGILEVAESACVLDVERLLREDGADPDPLPAGWQVTSDSIAARVARVAGAAELVLLKSALPADPTDRGAWSREGYVDEYFPLASAGLMVRAVNLRALPSPLVGEGGLRDQAG
jgi:5-(aminomethyl)-3-furanmethanol phosphate kinase